MLHCFSAVLVNWIMENHTSSYCICQLFFNCETNALGQQEDQCEKLSFAFSSTCRISVRVGSSFHDLQELEAVDLTEPTGWVHIATRDAAGHPVRTFFVQIAVLSNHQNGRDTHLRQIKVHSPVQQANVSVMPKVNFTSVNCRAFSCIR